MFRHRLTLFDLFGFRVRLDASWLLLAGLMAWSLAMGYFPRLSPGLPPRIYWSMGVVGVLILALSIVLHELAHALVGRRNGMSIPGITLFLFGGVAELEQEPPTPLAEFRMAVAGPLTSLALAALAYGAARGIEARPAALVLDYAALLNLMLAGFNMIPAFPLDGGRVVRAVLWAWRRDVVAATKVASTIGALFGVLLLVAGLWQMVQGNVLGGLWWLVVGLFVRAAAHEAYRQQLARKALSEHAVGRLMTRSPVTVPPDLPISALMDEIFVARPHWAYGVVDHSGRLLGQLGLDAATALPPCERADRTAAELMVPALSIDEAADAQQALTRMQRAAHPMLWVVRDDRLVGVLTLADLLPALTLRLG